MNKYAKAILATLAAFMASVQTNMPANTGDWIQAGASAVAVGLITWYVPNTDKSGTVIPPTPKA